MKFLGTKAWIAAMAGLLATGAASAVTIDFDGMDATQSYAPSYPLLGQFDFITQGDWAAFTYSNAAGADSSTLSGAIVNGADPSTCFGVSCPTGNNSLYLATVNTSTAGITRSYDSNPFSISSFSASFIASSSSATPAVAMVLTVEGDRADGSYTTVNFQIPGSSTNQYTFANYSLPSSFSADAFTTVYFYGYACNASGNCTRSSTNQAQFGLDNIAIAAAVPEPSQWLLMGLGLSAVGVAVRRRAPRS